MSFKVLVCLFLALWCGIAVAAAAAVPTPVDNTESSRADLSRTGEVDHIDVETGDLALVVAETDAEEDSYSSFYEPAHHQGGRPGRPGRPGHHGPPHHHHPPGRPGGRPPYPYWPYPSPYYPYYPYYGYPYSGYPYYGYPYPSPYPSPYPGYPYPYPGYPHRPRSETTTRLCKNVIGLGNICAST